MMNKKDEALKKCLRVLEPISEQRMYETQWIDSAIQACKEALNTQPKEPQYLYVYKKDIFNTISIEYELMREVGSSWNCIGKIKLEVEDD